MRKKEWKDIKGYKGYYQISNYGNIKSLDRIIKTKHGILQKFKGRNRILSPNAKGYLQLDLTKNGKSTKIQVHILVGKHFVKGYKKGFDINHKKGNKLDNRASQLEWCTRQQNIQHARDILKKVMGNKPTKILVISPKNKKIKFISQREASRQLKIRQSTIWHVLNGLEKHAFGYKFKYL
jgi:hypothetical protein